MKLATLALAALATMATFAAMIPQEWAVEVSRVKQYQFQANRGDTMELKATFWHDGKPFDLGGDTFRLYWQTNGMDSVYWSAAAVSASNTVSAVFANTMDPGAPIVYGFLGATSGNYRASFAIRYAPGPGAIPNELPLPAATIDFAKVEVLNPPYYTKAETDSTLREGLAAAASSATNYTDSVAQSLSESIAAAATLTPIYSDTPTFGEWKFSGTSAGTMRHWEVEWNLNFDCWALYSVSDSDSDDRLSVAPGDGNLSNTVVYFTEGGIDVTATRTRTDIIGYTLGSQSDKPLQPKGDYAPATNIAKSALASDVQASLGKADTALQTAPVTSVNNKTGAVSLTASDVGALGNSGSQTLNGVLTQTGSGPQGIEKGICIGNLPNSGTDWFFSAYGSYPTDITIRIPFSSAEQLVDVAPTFALLSDIPSVAGLAPLASPAFTGTPTAPTPASGDNSQKVATTAFVQDAISGISVTPLDGQTFDFATTQGVMDALKTVIETLGGTVTNAPSTTISQGE